LKFLEIGNTVNIGTQWKLREGRENLQKEEVNIDTFHQTAYSSPHNGPRRSKGGVNVWLYSFFNFGARWE
jgi:hypothetical protein